MMRLAIALLLASAVPAQAVELRVVTQFNDLLMQQIYRSPRPEAEALFVDTTIRGRLGEIDENLREALPFGPDMVLYFAPDGDLLAWSDKSAMVERGYWELFASSGMNELCIRFGSFGLASLCASPQIEASDWIIESTGGNPFGLVAGAAVPVTFAGGVLTLDTIAARVP